MNPTSPPEPSMPMLFSYANALNPSYFSQVDTQALLGTVSSIYSSSINSNPPSKQFIPAFRDPQFKADLDMSEFATLPTVNPKEIFSENPLFKLGIHLSQPPR